MVVNNFTLGVFSTPSLGNSGGIHFCPYCTSSLDSYDVLLLLPYFWVLLGYYPQRKFDSFRIIPCVFLVKSLGYVLTLLTMIFTFMSLVEVPEVDVAIWRAIALLVKTQELELDQEEGHLCCLQFAFGFCRVGTK